MFAEAFTTVAWATVVYGHGMTATGFLLLIAAIAIAAGIVLFFYSRSHNTHIEVRPDDDVVRGGGATRAERVRVDEPETGWDNLTADGDEVHSERVADVDRKTL